MGQGHAPEAFRSLVDARDLAAVLPDLLVEASRVAATVASGWHGRRRAGSGQGFWQFRPLGSGESAAAVDWRRSARDDVLHVREREWEAAHTVWLAPDLTPSMAYRSHLAAVSKRDRAVVLALALADLLGRAGERIGVPGRLAPRPDRHAAERLAVALVRSGPADAVPDPGPIAPLAEVVVIGDFLEPPERLETRLAALAATGARLHLVRIVDPAEALLPFAGEVEFEDPESGDRLRLPRVEDLAGAWEARWRRHGAALADLARGGRRTLVTHRTDRSAAEALLAVHAALGGARHGVAPPRAGDREGEP
ncbi:DUF58 domain-containing protein [Siculibacillus lacustris]|uniref:DUF58 domain-containing protein n=1 Tax=Siculibacillus lacustris TaxID=1549641 RepID=A0A4Q9VP29_9HYPH|nr:DUF58 domain-containing protein [Siculibacillus lacustris]TBW37442.1 DUF58 domain-containing protein [Siculibacillus lacustris]